VGKCARRTPLSERKKSRCRAAERQGERLAMAVGSTNGPVVAASHPCGTPNGMRVTVGEGRSERTGNGMRRASWFPTLAATGGRLLTKRSPERE